MKSGKGSPEPRGNQRNLKKQRSGAAPAVLTGLLAAGWEAGSEAGCVTRGWGSPHRPLTALHC